MLSIQLPLRRLPRSHLRWFSSVLLLTIPACIGPPLDVQPEELNPGTAGTPYEQPLTTETSGTHRWTVIRGALPAGLRLDAASGVVSGTPLEAGQFDFAVRVSDAPPSARTGERSYTLFIRDAFQLFAELPVGQVGQPYDFVPTINGGVLPYAVQVIGLPGGLSADVTTGRITGTPVAPTDGLTIEFNVQDSSAPPRTAMTRSTLVLRARNVSIQTDTLPAGRFGMPYTATLVAVDGREPYIWAVVEGVLPDGLRLNQATGVISGIPREIQTAQFAIRVTDADQPASTLVKQFVLEIGP